MSKVNEYMNALSHAELKRPDICLSNNMDACITNNGSVSINAETYLDKTSAIQLARWILDVYGMDEYE